MVSVLTLVLCAGFLAQGLCHRFGGNNFFPPGIPDILGTGSSHLCTTYFNVNITETIYPLCPPNTDCVNCRFDNGWWGWWRRPSCDSCCNNPVIVSRIVQRNKTVCCPGYYGWNCDKPFCARPCTDNNTNCVAPNTCGPACYPPCCNGGSCVAGSSGNVCSCPKGLTGPTCETIIPCGNTTETQCQNGGTCYSGICACAVGFAGVFCEKEICNPPCQNGGQCVNQKCNCVDGFTGDFCQIAPENILP